MTKAISEWQGERTAALLLPTGQAWHFVSEPLWYHFLPAPLITLVLSAINQLPQPQHEDNFIKVRQQEPLLSTTTHSAKGLVSRESSKLFLPAVTKHILHYMYITCTSHYSITCIYPYLTWGRKLQKVQRITSMLKHRFPKRTSMLLMAKAFNSNQVSWNADF